MSERGSSEVQPWVRCGLVAVAAVAIGTLAFLHARERSVAFASFRPGYQDEAEFNACAGNELDTEVSVPFVNSDPGWQWQTTVVVQNASTSPNTVALVYYDPGGTATTTVNDTLPPMGSHAYPTPGLFTGSLSVTSEQPVAVVAKDVFLDTDRTGDGLLSYKGIGSVDADYDLVLLPIFRQYEGWHSYFAIQNPGDAAVSVALGFFDVNGAQIHSLTDSLPPHGSLLYDAAEIGDLGSGFQGLVRVEGIGGNLVGVVKSENELTGEAVAHNNHRLADPGPQLPPPLAFLPHLSKTQTSTILLVNLGSMPSVCRVTLFDQDGNPLVDRFFDSVAPLSTLAVSLDDPGWAVPAGFRGSGLVESDHPFVALVETVWPDHPNTLTGYSGGSQGCCQPDTTAFVPVVRRSAGDTITMIGVQNTGTASADIEVTYYDEAGIEAATETVTAVPSSAARYFDQASGSLPNGFQGSAVVSATEPMLAIGLVSHSRPDTPELLSPSDGTITSTSQITFTWTVVDADSYNLWLNGTVFTTSEPSSSRILDEGTYTWAVRAISLPNNYSPYSPPWTLTVKFPKKVYLPIVVR